jgi:hypothetical protein
MEGMTELVPRQVIHTGLPNAETTAAWISRNQLLQHHPELATEAAAILSSAPPWLQECAIHAKLDPVLGRCSWEENSSLCIRFRQTHNMMTPPNIDRARIRSLTCDMLNKLQHRCWSDNAPFKIDEINFIGYFAHSSAEHKRLEGMITIEYRHHIPLEQDLQVALLLAMYIGNDIPAGEAGSGLKWCPIRNEIAHTSCKVTRVSARRSAGKSDDSSIIILDKIRSTPWNSKSPNLRLVQGKCEHRATQGQQISQSPPTSPQPSPRKESGNTQSTTPNWLMLIWSALSENRPVGTTKVRSRATGEPAQGPHEPVLQHDLPTIRDRSVALQLLHVLSSDPRGQADTHTFLKELEKHGHAPLARQIRRGTIHPNDG